jgi:hypothetical protein
MIRRPLVVLVFAAIGCGSATAPPPPPQAKVQTAATETKPQPIASAEPDAGPPPDGDGDQIADANDKCPKEPETYNGFEDEDGCPDKTFVSVGPNTIRPRFELHFQTGTSKILRNRSRW